MQAKRRFTSFDTDTDGKISFPEYAHFYKDVLSSNMSDEQFMRGCDEMLQSALKARAQSDSSDGAVTTLEAADGEASIGAARKQAAALQSTLEAADVDMKTGHVAV